MSDNDEAFAGGLAVGFVLCLVLLIISVCATSSRWEKDAHAHKIEAVRHGAAEWRTDESGQVSFHWKTNPVKP